MPNEPLYQFYETLPEDVDEKVDLKEEGQLLGNVTQQRSCLSRLSSGQQTGFSHHGHNLIMSLLVLTNMEFEFFSLRIGGTYKAILERRKQAAVDPRPEIK